MSQADWFEPAVYAGLGSIATLSAADLMDVHFRPLTGRSAPWLSEIQTSILNSVTTSARTRPTVVAAYVLLNVIADPVWSEAPKPFISPSENGGLTAEFRSGSVEVHLDARDDGLLSVYVFQMPAVEWEGPIDELPDGLEKWAWRLSHAI